MLIIYDETGKIINTETKKEEITGSLYCLEVTIPEGKCVMKIDTTQLPHVAVMEDLPKGELEQLRVYVQNSTLMLAMKDTIHDNQIKDIKIELDKINSFIKQNYDVKAGVI